MVKISNLHPVGGGMTIGTFPPQGLIMRLVFQMAIHTLGRRLAELFPVFVATGAGRGCMAADERKIRLAMVKNLFIQRHNIRLAPDMIRVALATPVCAGQR